jgi:hypothetical protein
MAQLQSAVGVFALIGFAWLMSEDRRNVAWRQAVIAPPISARSVTIAGLSTTAPQRRRDGNLAAPEIDCVRRFRGLDRGQVGRVS